jgi:hypothetical protein
VSAAAVSSTGKVRQLDRRGDPSEQVTEQQAKDPSRVARILMAILADVGLLKRRFWPDRMDFEGQVLDATGTKIFRFEHGFGVDVRFWVIDWNGAAAPNIRKDATTTSTVLVLTSTSAGTATIRVEAVG